MAVQLSVTSSVTSPVTSPVTSGISDLKVDLIVDDLIMVRLTQLLLMARRASSSSKDKPSWEKINRHFRYGMSRPWTIQSQVANMPGRDRKKVQVEPIKDWKFFKGDFVSPFIKLRGLLVN